MLEAVSVIVQVVSFKMTGKRVFRMAPIHHHFEQLGWTEPQIVIRFWIISVVLALAGPVDPEAAVMIPVTTFAGQEGRRVRPRRLRADRAASALFAGGADVVGLRRRRRAASPRPRSAGIPTADLRRLDWSKIAALVLAPGVPLTHPAPHWSVGLARAMAVEVIGDIELFCRERRTPCAAMRRSSPSPAPTASRPRPR